jgi:hypothetical protein
MAIWRKGGMCHKWIKRGTNMFVQIRDGAIHADDDQPKWFWNGMEGTHELNEATKNEKGKCGIKKEGDGWI